MNKNIKFDVITNTIIITKSFYEASMEFGSEEQRIIADIKKEYPDMKIVLKSSNTGNRKSEYKGLTYAYMRKFIRTMDKENLIVFEDVIAHYEQFGYTSGKLYQCVKEWFLENYPNHKNMITDATPKIAA